MEEECPKCPDEGLPPWMGTFADLMSLLMCFFVLLLSFATMDAIRFKKMAESMKDAFGVQTEVPANEIVMGVSVIKQEWSPSIAEQAVITEIRQDTSEIIKEHLKMNDDSTSQSESEMNQQEAIDLAKAAEEKELEEQFAELQEALELEIEEGLVDVEKEESKIIVRIREKGSFGSGSARLDPGFHTVMDSIASVLASRSGTIMVAGHTDNIPIKTGRFRSNWELSSARAVTVVHSMLRNKKIDQARVSIQGFADTKPLVDNDSAANRSTNRRVELILQKGRDDDNGEVIGTVNEAAE